MKRLVHVLVFAMFMISVLFTGCEKESGNHREEDHSPANNGEMLDSTVIRGEGTEVASLDDNKDGKLYQCPMDFEVISDTEGRCPKCKMYIEEYTIKEAGDNFSSR